MIIVLMGVSGSGKTTVGRALAERLGWAFHDADDLHPPANVARMRRGIPLTDEDRRPWLLTLARSIDDACARGQDLVLACSALKRAYQQDLDRTPGCVRFVHLDGPEELFRDRIASRSDHFMPASLLDSQLADLEPPEQAVVVHAGDPPETIVSEILRHLGL